MYFEIHLKIKTKEKKTLKFTSHSCWKPNHLHEIWTDDASMVNLLAQTMEKTFTMIIFF